MTKQILAFLFCFIRELNIYTPLISILPPAYPPIPHTPPAHPSAHPFLRNQPSTLLSARVTYEH
jgi:hypothetical protein